MAAQVVYTMDEEGASRIVCLRLVRESSGCMSATDKTVEPDCSSEAMLPTGSQAPTSATTEMLYR